MSYIRIKNTIQVNLRNSLLHSGEFFNLKKLLWVIGSIIVGIVVLAVISFTFYKSHVFSKENITVEEPAEIFPQYDQLTVDIAEYEYFNNHPFFYSKEEAEFFSLSTTLKNYALFHHLETNGYT